jgi:hypothetical protein
LVFPRGDTDARMNEDERLRSREPGGKRWRLRIDGSRRRRYDIEVAMATLERRFTPTEVRVDGEPLARADWSYRRDNRVLTAHVRCRVCTVVTRARMR